MRPPHHHTIPPVRHALPATRTSERHVALICIFLAPAVVPHTRHMYDAMRRRLRRARLWCRDEVHKLGGRARQLARGGEAVVSRPAPREGAQSPHISLLPWPFLSFAELLRSSLDRLLVQGGPKPRVQPSAADASVVAGAPLNTEDDVLHLRHLPDFGSALRASDAEYLLQVLLSPYLRIPLLLRFFADPIRTSALSRAELQQLLDAALFEPGEWQVTKPCRHHHTAPTPRGRPCSPSLLTLPPSFRARRVAARYAQAAPKGHPCP